MTYGLSFELNSVCQWVVTEEMMVKGGDKEKSIEYKRRLDLWMSLLLPSVASLQFSPPLPPPPPPPPPDPHRSPSFLVSVSSLETLGMVTITSSIFKVKENYQKT